MVIASDLAWRRAKYSEYGGSYVSSTSARLSPFLSHIYSLLYVRHPETNRPVFYATGTLAGEHNTGLFYYVIANAFLKAFLVILYMSQSFYGLKGGSNAPPLVKISSHLKEY